MPAFFVLFFLSALAQAQGVPKGFFIHGESLSPDGRYGVTVPILAEHGGHDDGAKNSLVEVKTGKVLAVIQAETGWDHMNHRSVLPARWSPDGSLLLWEVDGKWFSDALVLLKLGGEKVPWQSDILKAGQEAILARTKKADPEKYAKAKEANKGHGSAYPEGFSIDVEIIGPVTLPLRVLVNLTSNVKALENWPTLESHLEGVVDAEGKFSVKNFKLGASPGHSF